MGLQTHPNRVRAGPDFEPARQHKAASVVWFDKEPGLPNDTEILFLALLVVKNAESAGAASKWAADVLRFSPSGAVPEVWPPPGAPEWAGKGPNAAPLYQTLEKAYKPGWTWPALESICLAIRSFDGVGQHDNLQPHHLREHIKAKPPGPKLAGAKRAPPVRWKSPAILQVARLVKRDGAQLRQLLRLDAPREEVPTLRAQLAEARVQVEQMEAEAAKAKAALLREQGARRSEKSRRLKQKREKKEWRAAQHVKFRQRLATAVTRRRAQVQLQAAARLERENERRERENERREAELGELLKRRALDVARARKRAREAQGEAQQSAKRLQRAKRAEAALKRVRERYDELMDELMEATMPPFDSDSVGGRRGGGAAGEVRPPRRAWPL